MKKYFTVIKYLTKEFREYLEEEHEVNKNILIKKIKKGHLGGSVG